MHRVLAGFDFGKSKVAAKLIHELATALGVKAITEHGRRVRFFSNVELANTKDVWPNSGRRNTLLWLYLAAILDWATRRVLAWRMSNTLTADFCVAALEEEIAHYGAPEIFNTDQSSQFMAVPLPGRSNATVSVSAWTGAAAAMTSS